jgi:ubiquinone/menaquinone biosynthesis C-methylase UbiE
MDKKELVRKGYNKAAKKLQDIFGVDKEGSNKLELLSEFISSLPLDGQVLDAGCGNGAYSRYLSDKFKVTGIDISEKQIELARKNAPKAEFICGDMTKTHFPDDFFQGILAFYSIIHVPRKEHYELLKNFYRILQKEGIALLTFNLHDEPEFYDENFFDENVKMYWSGYDKETNLKILKKIGFRIIWAKSVKENPDFGESSHLFVLVKKKIS